MIDPYRVLGLDSEADDEAIRRAYLEAVRRHPPERDPERFERIRAAYDAVRDRRRRISHALFDREQPTVEDVLECLPSTDPPPRPDLDQLLAVLGGR
jgi:curved DNA-binding protein CbpA